MPNGRKIIPVNQASVYRHLRKRSLMKQILLSRQASGGEGICCETSEDCCGNCCCTACNFTDNRAVCYPEWTIIYSSQTDGAPTGPEITSDLNSWTLDIDFDAGNSCGGQFFGESQFIIVEGMVSHTPLYELGGLCADVSVTHSQSRHVALEVTFDTECFGPHCPGHYCLGDRALMLFQGNAGKTCNMTDDTDSTQLIWSDACASHTCVRILIYASMPVIDHEDIYDEWDPPDFDGLNYGAASVSIEFKLLNKGDCDPVLQCDDPGCTCTCTELDTVTDWPCC